MSAWAELRSFLGQRKKYWLAPTILLVLLFLMIVLLTYDSTESFTYTLF